MLNCCPFCGSDDGFYDKNIVSYQQFYNYNCEPILASEIQHVKGGKHKFCINCEKNITKHLCLPDDNIPPTY